MYDIESFLVRRRWNLRWVKAKGFGKRLITPPIIVCPGGLLYFICPSIKFIVDYTQMDDDDPGNLLDNDSNYSFEESGNDDGLNAMCMVGLCSLV